MNKTRVIIEKGKDGSFGLYTPDTKCTTLIGEGNTVEEAKEDFNICYQEILDYYKEENKPIPEELQNLQFEYEYDVSSMLNEAPFLNVSATAKYIGINPSLMRQYKRGQSVSKAQMLKIQNGIREIGRKLASITLL